VGFALGLGAGLAALAAVGRRGSRSQRAITNVKHPWKDVVAPYTQKEIQAHMNPEKGEKLIEEIREHQGHYGRGSTRSGGQPDSWTFDIKVYPSIPEWVTTHLGDQAAWEQMYETMNDEREWTVELLSADDSSLYQPWFSGDASTAGRQGGWLVLPYEGLDEDLEELLYDYDDNTRVILGGRKVIADPGYRSELFDATEAALNALRRRAWLEEEIGKMKKTFEEHWSSDESWQEKLDITKQQRAELQAQQQQSPRRRW
jgi:hypothetical protein